MARVVGRAEPGGGSRLGHADRQRDRRRARRTPRSRRRAWRCGSGGLAGAGQARHAGGHRQVPDVATTRSRPARFAIDRATSAALNELVGGGRLGADRRAARGDGGGDDAVRRLDPDLGEGAAHLVGDAGRIGEVGTEEHGSELLATVSGDEVGGAHARAQHGAELAEDLVPRLVPVSVIQVTETVEIEHDRRERNPVGGIEARALREQLLEGGVEIAAIEETGQGVTDRHVGDVGVQEGVRDGQRCLLGEEAECVTVDGSEAARPHATKGEDPHRVAMAEQGDRRRAAVGILGDDDGALDERTAGRPVAGDDEARGRGVMQGGGNRHLARGAVDDRQRGVLRRDDRHRAAHDRRVELGRLERRAHRLAEGMEVTEELRALEQPLALAADHERRR